jgi:hypothetical protein
VQISETLISNLLAGRPVTGYYIEKRDRNGEWVRVNNFPTPNLTMTVQGLHEGMKYDFRVVAVNEAGVRSFFKNQNLCKNFITNYFSLENHPDLLNKL